MRVVIRGRPMQRKYQTRRHITVYLDEEEYSKISSVAGEGRVSQWARGVLLCELESGGKIRHRSMSEALAEAPAAKAKVSCPHGYAPGYRCTLCGGVVGKEGKVQR